ncbi:putative o-methyltransferase protein [Phaeoacremonium minimum UCRPA7]|uniref:Putative o-methyltransferase protein n=1 Tax=Phaeoacremonium minimum (strain UCR-PA7) TaxID=1286976 RepID=R8BEW9_PHAM7|nr:putative o-methyltransferase protein [Phaeoacremonium minimum UCRPA7]EON97848.1 putative o-methyltransferase protein [Phaeoacremonium minimum UCRPA7]
MASPHGEALDEKSTLVNHSDAPNAATRWVLCNLIQQLRFSKEQLSASSISTTVAENLYGTKEGQLPHKELVGLAADAVDLLHDIQRRLEPSHLTLADHFFGYMNAKCLVAAVELGIPDALKKQPLTIDQLAATVQARPDRTAQVMRALYNNGIFQYDHQSNVFSNNAASEMLTSDHWTQWRNWVDLYGNEFYDIARGIPASLKADTKRSAAQHNYDTDDDMFTYFQKQGWVPRLHRTLGGGATAQAPGILADYPWHEIADQTVIDIGGGGGALIAALLRNHDTMRGGVFDLIKVIEHIRPFFNPGGMYEDVCNRVPSENLIAGNFLEEVPAYHVYTMKWCLHDWNDADAIKVLCNIRRAILGGEKSRLIVLESVRADGAMGRLSRYGDINMMMTAKGQERSEKEWRFLAESSGWAVSQIYPLRNAWVSAIEFRPSH